MSNDRRPSAVAVYWDFENIHAAVLERDNPGGYASPGNRFRPQDVVVDIDAVMQFAATIGTVVVNRAYANWQWFARYSDGFNAHGLDLVQLYYRGLKNGADIRLALDVLEDIHHHPHITHVVIVGGDSDYISLAQKVRQAGRAIIGIGTRENANRYWVACCNEFKYYSTLLERAGRALPSAGAASVDESELDAARTLLETAAGRLTGEAGERIPRSRLKQLMLRIDPAFDEANYGYRSFGELVRAFPDLVENIENDSGGFVRLRAQPAGAGASVPAGYAALLGRACPPDGPWRIAVDAFQAAFDAAPGNVAGSFEALERDVAQRIADAGTGIEATAPLARRVRMLLFALRLFELLGTGHGLRLRHYGRPAALLDAVDRGIVRELLRAIGPAFDRAATARLLYGDDGDASLARLQQVVDALEPAEAAAGA